MRHHTAILVLAVTLAACDPMNAIHVEPGSRADSLVFHAFQRPDSVHGADALSTIEVMACDSSGRTVRPVWRLRHDERGWISAHFHPSPVTFRYGADSIPGWTIMQRAEPLHAGLYAASAEGGGIGGYQRFFVDSLGHVAVEGGMYRKFGR
jgi:hypothetical protein